MAVVSLFSKAKAASVQETVKQSLTKRFLNRMLGDSESDSDSDYDDKDIEKGAKKEKKEREKETSMKGNGGRGLTAGLTGREQAMPADAVLASAGANDVSFCAREYLSFLVVY